MKDLKQADRGISMKQQYRITDFPKSGFPLVYNSHVGGLAMGRMYPGTYQYIMAGDKFAGRNEFSLIAEKLATPVVSDVHISQHNYFVTLRSVDRGFEELQTPTKNNQMSANLSTPMFSLYDVVKAIVIEFRAMLPHFQSTNPGHWVLADTGTYSFEWSEAEINTMFASLTYRGLMANSYIDDAFEDLRVQLVSYGAAYAAFDSSTTEDELRDFYIGAWSIIFDFFCGEGSLMDYFGMPIFSHDDVSVWFENVVNLIPVATPLVTNRLDILLDEEFDTMLFEDDDTWQTDRRLIWEYPLRAYYAIWYEHYRNMWLEPRTSSLWDYKDWGSTPLLSGSTLDEAICTLLPMRISPWTDDPFNTSQIDDMSRHVFAPIVENGHNEVSWSSPSMPSQGDSDLGDQFRTGNMWSDAKLSYIDTDGVSRDIVCPIPQALSGIDFNFDRKQDYSNFATLDLFTLKKAHMLERFLKRNLAFGDEYRDRVKAQYGVTIEDYRINRPHYLGGSVDSWDIKQEVANGGTFRAGASLNTNYVHQGDRLATVTAASNYSDGFEFFATEFGIYIGILKIVPLAQYNHTDPIVFTQKMQDFPIPAFAMQQEDINNTAEIYRRGFINKNFDNKPFGHVPYAHGWRYRIDEVHGQMISSKFDYTFARFFRGLTDDGTPKLNYWFLHCRPNLPMFVDSILLDGQFYGTLKHNFYVERSLPQPVETI